MCQTYYIEIIHTIMLFKKLHFIFFAYGTPLSALETFQVGDFFQNCTTSQLEIKIRILKNCFSVHQGVRKEPKKHDSI